MDEFIFSGLKVVDLATVIAGPVAATILADFGADVVKVEEPTEGDSCRILSGVTTTPDADADYFWQMAGRNKRSLTLNLKMDEGMAILRKLIDECDVFITNQPHAVRERFGLDYESLKERNPRMIYASLTAFGEHGPDRGLKAFDQVAYWARSGLMDLVRSTDSLPAQALPGMGDHPTSITLYASIVTALLNRERTGEGSLVHTSLLANGLWSVASIAQGGLAGADLGQYIEAQRRKGFGNRVYLTADNRYLQLNMIRTEDQVLMLFVALDLVHLMEDERFTTIDLVVENRDPLGEMVQEVLITKKADEWMSLFQSMEVDVRLVPTIAEAIEDEQMRINRMVVPPVDPDVGMPWVINHPIKVSNVPQVGPKRAPELGEHSEEILSGLGYSQEEISKLGDLGVV